PSALCLRPPPAAVALSSTLFSSMLPRPPHFPLFPYTTLFRSGGSSSGVSSPTPRGNGHCPGHARRHRRRDRRRALDRTHEPARPDRKSTRLNSSHVSISYAVFCLKKKKRRHAAPRWSSARRRP